MLQPTMMVHGAVEKNNGHIAVYSQVGKGTTFKIYFSHVDESPESISSQKEHPLRKGWETILLVEDDEALRKLTSSVLSGQGLLASSGQMAERAWCGRNWRRPFAACMPGGREYLPKFAVKMAEHHGDDALTPREIEILRQVAAGNANKMIADNFSISEQIVKAHMRSILSKLGANYRTHAVTIALQRGIIEI